jgi:hypothetical protein
MSQIAMNPAAPLSARAYNLIRAEVQRTGEPAHDGMDDRTKVICHSRDWLRGRELQRITRRLSHKHRPLWRALDAVATAWGMLWAITVGGCWIEMGERLGLWIYIGDRPRKSRQHGRRRCAR